MYSKYKYDTINEILFYYSLPNMESCNKENPYELKSFQETELSAEQQQEYNNKMEELSSWKPWDDEFWLQKYEEENFSKQIEDAQEPLCDEQNPYGLKTWEESQEEKTPSKNLFSQVKKFFNFFN